MTKCAQFRFIEAPKLCIERPVARKLAGGVGAPSCGAAPLGDAPGLLAHFDLESFDESPSRRLERRGCSRSRLRCRRRVKFSPTSFAGVLHLS
jgi:hypothetical protein